MFRTESRYTIIALDWQVYDQAEAQELMAAIPVSPSAPRSNAPKSNEKPRWGSGWFGLLSYDDYALIDSRKLGAIAPRAGTMPGMLAYIHRSLVIDHQLGNWQQVTAPAGAPGPEPAQRIEAESFWPWRQYVTQPAPAPNRVQDPAATSGLALIPDSGSDEDYLAAVAAVRADIEAGRFYQLNLLRYFKAADAGCLSALTRRYLRFYEPYSLWCRWPSAVAHAGHEVVSFSPERFVAIDPCHSGDAPATLVAEPIKGTMGRGATEAEDKAQKKALSQSAKDKAELHMIVDLLRHDMWPVCQPQSIAVRHPHRLKTFKRVHHLVATIAGSLKLGLSLAEFWAALLPAGSITGTPKREVMTAIRELEGRGRGLFMGVAFHFCPSSGALDSSVLIRTVLRDGKNVSYAAGSGLTIRSDPAAELAEIGQKCRVVTDPLA